ncbi:MAG: cation:proton antiporter [Burkholderiales bacterium]|nr:cation:proton antiporter [Burkholderiales bacterium]
MSGTLEFVLMLLAAAVFVVVAFRSVGLPPLIGYLIVGVAVGPNALALAPDVAGTRHLAEFGVVFLMFSIGLEFSLARLFQVRRLVFGLGGLQVLAVTLLVGAGAMALGIGWQGALALGGALAMSSTAIASRMLAERVELETAHGRETVAVLLFQDLAVVPFLIVVPALAGRAENLGGLLALAFVKAAAALALILFIGQRLMRSWFHVIARRRSHELFILNVLLITLGLAWVTELAGLSLALGAFLAGMLIAETEYRHQVEEDIRPFRDVLLGLFFVAVGMYLDLAVVWRHLGAVLLAFVAPMAIKLAVVFALSRVFGSSAGTALRSALALAGAGEFGLVLVIQAAGGGLLSDEAAQIVVAGILLSMLASPLLIQKSDRIVLKLVSSEWMMRAVQLHQAAVQTLASERHVVIAGYGRTGQSLARFLERENIGYVALDLDPERVREAAAAGDTVVFGDAARREMLVAAGVRRASALVVTYIDTASALKVLHHAHEVNPGLPVIVRTRDDSDLERLTRAGATEVVPETFESSLMLASHALVLLGVPIRRVLAEIRSAREQRYSLLRGFFPGASDEPDDFDEDTQLRLHSVPLEGRSYAVGRTLGDLALDALGAEVTLVRRRSIRATDPGPETRLEAGDVVVLRGTPDALAAAELRLLQG